MKKIFIITIVVLGATALIFFLVKFLGQGFLSELIGQNTIQKNKTTYLQKEKLLNQKVPFFDLVSTGDNRIKLSQFIDKPFVVIFWASWNTESINQLKIVDEYNSSRALADKIVPVVLINSLEDLNVAKSFIRRGGYNINTAIDTKGDITESFNIKSLPTAFFIDKSGIIKEIYTGVLSKSIFVDKIEQLLQ